MDTTTAATILAKNRELSSELAAKAGFNAQSRICVVAVDRSILF